jgi:hypothetical protein
MIVMPSRRNVLTVALAALVGVAAPAVAATSFDTDNDGTVDIDEAKKAASALFDKWIPTRMAPSISRN